MTLEQYKIEVAEVYKQYDDGLITYKDVKIMLLRALSALN